MANTVSTLSYANTFGDWVVTTNSLVKENNDLAANNYTKPTGTLYLNDPTLGLQVANNAVVAGQLQVQGVGSSAYIQNNLRVDTQVYFTNTTLGLTNSGQANIGGPLLALGSGTGLTVSNNAVVTGNLTVSTNEVVGGTLHVTGATTLSNTLNVASSAQFDNYVYVLGSVNVTNDVNAKDVNATTLVTTAALSVTNNGTIGNTLNVNNNLNVSNVTSSNVVNTSLIAVTGKSYSDSIQANSSINTASLSVTGNIYTNRLIANSSVTIPSLTVSTLLDANNSSAFFGSVQTQGQLTVGGNFVINGATVYNSNTFTLSAASNNQISYFNVYRSSSNASIRWNETQKYWDMYNVDNSNYYRILTTELLSDSLTSTSSGVAASSAAANTLNTNLVAANTAMKTYVDGLVTTANTSMKSYVDANVSSLQSQITSNTASLQSQITANTTSLQSQITANTTSLQSQISSNVALIASIDATQNAYSQAAYARANTSVNTLVGTSGTLTANGGVISITSTNGVTAVGSGNTITLNTPQDVRTSASPTFAGLSLTAALPINQGGTGSTSAAAALTALLPTGTTSGYVLTTGGPGNFYWAAGGGGGGGGVTPGTTINSTRLTYTGNATSTLYTTPSYTPGASQLRVYLDGVRQYASEYTETSTTSVTFTTAPPSGSAILIEVDGYYVNPYYANNITFTAPFGGIVATANTIQLAIQDLDTRKASLAGASFTGSTTGLTMATGTSNTAFATTAFVTNTLGSGSTYAISVSGNAATVTNGVYTNGSYSNPSWITGLAWSKISSTPTTISGYGITDAITTGNIGSQSVSYASTAGSATTASSASSASSLDTSGNYRMYSLGVGVAASGTSGEIRAGGNITAYYSSDRKFKTNVQNIPNALSKVECIGGKLFDWTDEYIQQQGGEDGYFVQKSDFGVIAQDVQQVFPQAVRTREDGSLAVDYAKLSALAFAAIAELKAEIDALKGK